MKNEEGALRILSGDSVKKIKNGAELSLLH